ncbi:glycosyl hydrolase family 65 protein [Geobacillus sp. C56-T3]|uniref:glycosyl hydrolase family 65 protein n=1 Tax=Geobacillus sp. (strain C56-T3) TaxID=691437 RepID=UPI0002FC13E1|nr:glycosyl hydrolase family 65 protein [Geobacillus sp. C56-T3]
MSKEWIIEQTFYDKTANSFYETLFALSNGYVGVRLTTEFESVYSIPGAFFANVYDYGLSVPNHIVNAPNWLDTKIIINDERINLDYVDILDFKRILDMKRAFVKTFVRFRDSQGRITRYTRLDLVHGDNLHLAMSRGWIVPENYDGQISIESALNYRIGNAYHGGYFNQCVRSHHWETIFHESSQGITDLLVRTLRTKIALAIQTQFTVSEEAIYTPLFERNRCGTVATFNVSKGKVHTYTQYVTFATSLDNQHPMEFVRTMGVEVSQAGFEELLFLHEVAWEQKWQKAFVDIKGDSKALEGIRYAVFHLLAAPYTRKWGTNIPARGLTSEYHNGHFFFNTDLYKVPFFCWVDPEVARSLISYRINTLEAAKEHAKELGYKGARWSEESDYDGRPAGPTTLTNYVTGVTTEEWTGRMVHYIGANVAFSIWTYATITGDYDFVIEQAFDLLIEIARFYSNLAEYNPGNGCYEFKNTMGPDEYHYPVNNSFYTNQLIKWTLGYVIDVVQQYRKKTGMLGVSDQELHVWNQLHQRIRKPRQDAEGVYEQFDGYFELPDQQVEAYGGNGRPVIPNEVRQLSANFKGVGTKLIKQCDVVMLMSLLRSHFSVESKRANQMYYDARTVHESSLSATHAGIVSGDVGDVESAYRFFLMSTRFNLDFEPRKGYNNGLHLGSFAGGWLILLYSFLGIQINDERLEIKPQLPNEWQEVTVHLMWRGRQLRIYVDQRGIRVGLLSDEREPVELKICGKLFRLTSEMDVYVDLGYV